MCGIAGILGLEGDPAVAVHAVADMTATLRHRGPDDDGLAHGEGWAVGMTRLAVQDTSRAGHQPMRRGSTTLVFNGEVYNFPELRRELEGRGRSFESGTDTEVVLEAYREWGTDAFARFNGMFALCLIDDERQHAVLARDRFGKKPLFLARLEDRLVFASELKALMAVARERLTLSRSSLARYFRYQYVPAPHTIFQQVEKVPPATWLDVDLRSRGTSGPRRFWDLEVASNGVAPATPEEVLEAVSRSVRRRLIADVPVGAFLSGGTDSSLVVACMREAAADTRTFSIGFADPRFDESPYALAVADVLGTDHTHHQLEWSDALKLIPEFPTVYDEPFADSSAIPTMMVSRIARRDVTVALSGDGGDEFFGGYGRYRSRRFFTAGRLLPRTLARAMRGTAVGRRYALPMAIAAAPSPGAGYEEVISIWRSQDLRRLMPEVPLAPGFDGAFSHPGTGMVGRMMLCDAGTYLIEDILQKVDRATMAVSLEARNPLLDPEVVELGLRSLASAESDPGAKPLLRDTLRLKLPDRLVDRPKMGFGVPIGDWLRHDLRHLVEDLVLARKDAEYDVAVAHATCRQHLAESHDSLTPRVWSLLAFELWRNRWLSAV